MGFVQANPETNHQSTKWKKIMTEAQKILITRVEDKNNVDHFLINSM
jgi:hypothetical protein